LQKARLDGAWLEKADLRGADLRGADLIGAFFCDANLEGANLEGAMRGQAQFGGANLSNASGSTAANARPARWAIDADRDHGYEFIMSAMAAAMAISRRTIPTGHDRIGKSISRTSGTASLPCGT
jgi:hypothetical protein